MSRIVEVAGVDGCRRGWLVVPCEAAERLRLLDITVVRTFDELLAHTRRCAAVAVDIPIGLSDSGPRAADVEAHGCSAGRA